MIKKILIIDDDSTDQKLIKRAIEHLDIDCEVDVAGSGKEGLAKIEDNPVDLVLLDVNLAGEDGFEIHKQIKAAHPKQRIIILTGSQDPEHYRKANMSGVEAYINKNSIDQSLKITITRLIKTSPAH